MNLLTNNLTRRRALGAGLATAGMHAMPSILPAQARSLNVGAYAGYFKKSFDENIFHRGHGMMIQPRPLGKIIDAIVNPAIEMQRSNQIGYDGQSGNAYYWSWHILQHRL